MKKILIALLLVLSFSTISEATTLATIRGRVREYLYETDEINTIYTNTFINEAINEAQYMVLDVLPTSANYNMLTTYSVAISSVTNSYSLPTDFRSVVATSLYGKPIIQLKQEEFYGKYLNATTKDPMFCIFNNKINVYPATTGTLEIMYMKQPTFLDADTKEVSTIQEFDKLITMAATIYVLRLDNQVARSEAIARQFLDEVQMKGGTYINTNQVNKTGGGK